MFAREGHAAAGSYLGMLPAHLQMLSAALLLCLCSSSASAASREMRWMEDGAGAKMECLPHRNDGVGVGAGWGWGIVHKDSQDLAKTKEKLGP